MNQTRPFSEGKGLQQLWSQCSLYHSLCQEWVCSGSFPSWVLILRNQIHLFRQAFPNHFNCIKSESSSLFQNPLSCPTLRLKQLTLMYLEMWPTEVTNQIPWWHSWLYQSWWKWLRHLWLSVWRPRTCITATRGWHYVLGLPGLQNHGLNKSLLLTEYSVICSFNKIRWTKNRPPCLFLTNH